MGISSDMMGFPCSGVPVLADVSERISLGTFYKAPFKPDNFMIDVVGNNRLLGALTLGGALTGVTSITANGAISGLSTLSMSGAATIGGAINVTGSILPSATSEIGSTLVRPLKAWLQNLEVTNVPTVSGEPLATIGDVNARLFGGTYTPSFAGITFGAEYGITRDLDGLHINTPNNGFVTIGDIGDAGGVEITGYLNVRGGLIAFSGLELHQQLMLLGEYNGFLSIGDSYGPSTAFAVDTDPYAVGTETGDLQIRTAHIIPANSYSGGYSIGTPDLKYADLYLSGSIVSGGSITGGTSTALFQFVTDNGDATWHGPQLKIGGGGTTEKANGLIINPAGNIPAELKMMSTGGAGARIFLGTGNASWMNIGWNLQYSGAFQVSSGTSYLWDGYELFSVHTSLGLGTRSNNGVSLAGTAAPAGSPAAGGSIPNGTYYYKVTCVDYGGVETTHQRSTQSAAKVFGSGNNQITLSWTAVPGAVSYKVYRTTTNGTYSTPCYLGATTSTSYTDSAASASAGAPPSFTFGSWSSRLNSNGVSYINAGGLYVGTQLIVGGTCKANDYYSADNSQGVTGSFLAGSGETVQVKNGLITLIVSP